MTGLHPQLQSGFWPKNTYYFPHLQDWISLIPYISLKLFFHHLKIPRLNLNFFLFSFLSSFISSSHSLSVSSSKFKIPSPRHSSDANWFSTLTQFPLGHSYVQWPG